MKDMVNNPPHYTSAEIECIDAIKASMTPEGFACFLKGQVMKYMWRYEKKWNQIEDLKKANWYLEKLICHVKENPGLFVNGKDFTVDIDMPVNKTLDELINGE